MSPRSGSPLLPMLAAAAAFAALRGVAGRAFSFAAAPATPRAVLRGAPAAAAEQEAPGAEPLGAAGALLMPALCGAALLASRRTGGLRRAAGEGLAVQDATGIDRTGVEL